MNTPFNMFPAEGFVGDGFHPSLDEAVYRRDPAVAVSDIKDLVISPRHFYDKKVMGRRQARTQAQEIGTLIHLALLEPERFMKDTVLEPDDAPKKPTKAQLEAAKKSDKTLAAIAWWDDWNARHAGKLVMSRDDLSAVNEAKASVHANREASELLSGATVELAMFRTVTVDGIKIRTKGKADIVTAGRWIADIKTVQRGAANLDDFGASIAHWGYHMQAPWYMDLHNGIAGDEADNFEPGFESYVPKAGWKFIVVEKEAPFDVVVMELDEEDIRIGREQNKKSLQVLAACVREGRWPGGDTGGSTVKLPAWARRKTEN